MWRPAAALFALIAVGAVTLVITTPGGTTTALRESASPAGQADTLQRQYVSAVRTILPSIVQISTSSGLGSGIVFDTKGDIVTNAHVAGSATSFSVTLASGRRFSGRLVGSYATDDLAVISIGAHGARPARFADSSKVVVGEIVLAAGNPLGLQSSVTDGIVSAVGRDVSEGGGVVLPGTIQTSAAINPGNSGGALVDLAGRVVGIPTLAAATGSGAAPGIGFAIPSNLVRDIAGQIIRHGHVVDSHRAALGISVADSLERPGALVVAVQKGGPAGRAGVVAGDAIVAVDDVAVPDAESLFTVLARRRPGQSVKVTVTHADGARATLTVTLGRLSP